MVWRYRFGCEENGHQQPAATLHVCTHHERSEGESCISPRLVNSHRQTSARQQPTNDYEQNSNREWTMCHNATVHRHTALQTEREKESESESEAENSKHRMVWWLAYRSRTPPETHLSIYDIIIKCSHLITRSKSQCENGRWNKKKHTERTTIDIREAFTGTRIFGMLDNFPTVFAQTG